MVDDLESAEKIVEAIKQAIESPQGRQLLQQYGGVEVKPDQDLRQTAHDTYRAWLGAVWAKMRECSHPNQAYALSCLQSVLVDVSRKGPRRDTDAFKTMMRRAAIGATEADWVGRWPERDRIRFHELSKRDQERLLSRYFDGIEPKGSSELRAVNRLVQRLCSTRMVSLDELVDEGWYAAADSYSGSCTLDQLLREVFTTGEENEAENRSWRDPRNWRDPVDGPDTVAYCEGCHPWLPRRSSTGTAPRRGLAMVPRSDVTKITDPSADDPAADGPFLTIGRGRDSNSEP